MFHLSHSKSYSCSTKKKVVPPKRKRIEEEEEEEEEEDEQNDDDDNDGSAADKSDSDDDSDKSDTNDEDEDNKKPQKKTSKKTSTAKGKASVKSKDEKKRKKAKVIHKSSESASDKQPRSKKMSKVERLEEARKSFKWWEAPELPDGLNWRKLEHAGVFFAPPYVKHGIPMKYEGKVLLLTEQQEEMASFYAAMPDDGPQLGIPKTRGVFQKNFFAGFKATFPAGAVMKKFDKCDFTAIKEHLSLQKSLRKAATDDEKAAKKVEKEEAGLQYGYCLIDGRMERVSDQ